ncbi:ABC transporter permease [Propionibacterium australiense]|uniref:ABC-2 family transporter protein n=1 Tax=Propionibacterium australiense TaxID=119981 RepID=A0A383S7W1_9ACTN|nr:hypothetical protein [Propionibacterium australiense]SYZ34007.1 Hypothetical protein PROPAUS_1972 [Propionibacterium australiense]VEH91342.1 Uncharacterised protein [Propionibacterium australiense]
MPTAIASPPRLGVARPASGRTGVRALLAVTLRQECRSTAPWIVLVSALSASSIAAYRWIFPNPADRAALALTVSSSPALELIFGPARELMTNDGFNAWRAGMLGALLSGLMAILLVVRTSRADEDSGRAELVAAGVISRRARLLVPVVVTALASVVLGALCFLLTWAFGGQIAPTLVLSASFTASALVFGSLASLTAQLGSEAHTANWLAIGTMGALYVVRGYLDASNAPAWTQWLTPFGWFERTGPAVENDPLPLLAALGLTVAFLTAALVAAGHRDFGLGVVPLRAGRAAAPHLSCWVLPWRLHRGSLAGWFIAFALLGLVMGTLSTSVLADNPVVASLIAAGATSTAELTAVFIATILQLIGIIAAIMGTQVIMGIRAEELDHRLEPLLAGPLHRSRYLAANVLVALVPSGCALLVAGTGIGLVNMADGTGIGFGEALRQAACTIPAVWLLVALATAAVGARPALRMIGWGGIVATFAITLLGPTFDLPEWAMSISPMHHVPNVMAGSVSWGGLTVVSAITLGLLAAGFAGFRCRDVH